MRPMRSAPKQNPIKIFFDFTPAVRFCQGALRLCALGRATPP